MFPNLYIVLVGRPGIGKGEAMNPAIGLLKEAGTINTISDRTTMEFALEKLSKGFPSTHNNGNSAIKLGNEAACLFTSTELSVFITASQFAITCLTDLWDCREGIYHYGTRGKGEWNVKDPIVNLIGASAQEWLVKSIPADAVGGGFTRRVNFILGLVPRKDPPKKDWWERDRAGLVEDLRRISTLRGVFTLTPQAEKLFKQYQDSCVPEDFDDMASSVYKVSKWTNAGKLAQVLAISRGDQLLIQEEDIARAIQEIELVAEDLKIIFRSVGESDLATTSERILKFIEVKGFASRKEILAHNWRHFTANELDVVIASFREAGILYERQVGASTLYALYDKKGNQTP